MELGSGTGLLALWLARLDESFQPKRVIATDVPAMMPLMQLNINHNAVAASAPVVGVELDWTQPFSDDVAGMCPFDVVVAADVLYESECILPLVETLVRVSHQGTYALLALSYRTEGLERIFFDAASRYFNFVEETHLSPDADLLRSDGVILFRLLRNAAAVDEEKDRE